MIKKIISISLAALILTTASTSVMAEEHSGEFIACADTTLKQSVVLPVGQPIYEHLQVNNKIASISVNITSPCDEEYRSTYSNYAYEANRVVERTDDYLSAEFGIDFVSVAQPLWSSSSTTVQGLLDEAKAEHGLTYNGNKTADIMMAFSDVNVGGTYGATYTGTPYAIMFHSNYDQDAKSCQHEFGHVYGLGHHTTTGKCVMKQGSDTTLIDNLCTTHYNQWNNAKNKY
ncbi:hypothetical protein acsn021_24910 [Anaerocolumna cellulosilytica]|uniref:Uncharacterized protein n=1 Tax=Anaerocolumna cellulosilytica TaxID=433286 RepID=A0A6S6R644_9FIRM|nr:M12 family metallo-peptidase [Anaerocolumna cellulosilytica]MBB5193862.1 hypothetical protein [Anaerocolumna cellulosilytica]BCJ94922.1 hypothetical protein acsn021_24910 [Anaerocolumna cellulosilytica]